MKEQLLRWLGGGYASSDAVIDVNIDEVHINPYQPRKEFKEKELVDLARSIQDVGLIQPILIRSTPRGWELIAGERRLRASKLAGRETIPAIVKNLNDRQTAEMSLVENMQRQDLNYFEEAEGFALMIGEFDLTQEELAKRLGKSQSAIANKLRLLKLSRRVREVIDCAVITERHVRAILQLDSEEMQLALLREIYTHNLTVRETEILLNRINGKISQKTDKEKAAHPEKPKREVIDDLNRLVNNWQARGSVINIKTRNAGEWVEYVIRVRK